LLIKAVTTLDVLSGGRAWLGVGAGYQQDEAREIGLPLPPRRERFVRLEATLRLAQQMWSDDRSPFEARHNRLERPLNNPRALSSPRPPILVGGAGERRTLRLVTAYANACNVFDIPDGGKTIQHKLEVLLEKTVSRRLNPDESPERFAERCAALAELGIDHTVVITQGPLTEEAGARLAAGGRR
jgi:alkanesulfonate monooxygenase SsuD/methylene tetrahydromethanopterin reductase-like flavin-dependent oxidoreductase (luciferase family)